MLARDINDAFTSYNPATGFTPDKGTQQTDEDLERAGVPTINVVEEWRKAGVWNDDWIVETVRITPWGKTQRPYFFEQSVTVTLTTPWLTDVEIRYTLDGSEPTAASPLYEKPLSLAETRSVRTAAFRGQKLVSVPTSAFFVRLPPRPPQPDVFLDDLKYVLDPYSQASGAAAACFWQPKVGKSYEGLPLRVRGKVYAHGLGFRAPSSVRYELKPEYDRFVALAGIADNMLDHELGPQPGDALQRGVPRIHRRPTGGREPRDAHFAGAVAVRGDDSARQPVHQPGLHGCRQPQYPGSGQLGRGRLPLEEVSSVVAYLL